MDKLLSINFATGGVWGKEIEIEIQRHGETWTDHRITNDYRVNSKSAKRLSKVLNLYILMGKYEIRSSLYFGSDGEVHPGFDIVR